MSFRRCRDGCERSLPRPLVSAASLHGERLLGDGNMALGIDVARIVDEVDPFERRNGERRIAYRTVVHDLERFYAVVPAPGGLSQARYLDQAVRGKRGQGDFSYEIFPPSRGGR